MVHLFSLEIEWHIRGYHRSLKRLKEIREEAYYSTPKRDNLGIQKTGYSDPTQRDALKLTDPKLLELERILKSITYVLNTNPELKEFVKVHYWDKSNVVARSYKKWGSRKVLMWQDSLINKVKEAIE